MSDLCSYSFAFAFCLGLCRFGPQLRDLRFVGIDPGRHLLLVGFSFPAPHLLFSLIIHDVLPLFLPDSLYVCLSQFRQTGYGVKYPFTAILHFASHFRGPNETLLLYLPQWLDDNVYKLLFNDRP
jgi:hypothetical protein